MSFQPPNPYAPAFPPAPAGPPVAPGAPGPLVLGWPTAPLAGMGLKWIWLAAWVLTAALYVLVLLAAPLGLPAPALIGLRVAIVLLALGTVVVAAVWVSRAWASVPPELVGRMAPSEAAVRLVLPIYGYYWMFEVNRRLCAALDTVLASARSAERAPKSLAIVAPLLTLAQVFTGSTWGSPVFLAGLAVDLAWFIYMLRFDAARRAAYPMAD